MSSGYVSRMWFAWVPPKMRDIAIFSECRKRDVPVGNLSSRNNSVATPFSGCCHVPFVLVRVYLFVFFRLLFRSLSLSLPLSASLRDSPVSVLQWHFVSPRYTYHLSACTARFLAFYTGVLFYFSANTQQILVSNVTQNRCCHVEVGMSSIK